MAVTRAKANALLNAAEMGLYDDSRANALRGHSGAQLARLVSRARTARDRARDLEKRQKLALRKSTGSKTGRTGQANARTGEKAELLADILKRFEAQQKTLGKRERDALKKTSAGKATATKAASKKAASKKAPSGKAPTSRGAARVAVRKAARKVVAAKKGTGTGSATKKAVTTKKPAAAGKSAAKKTVPAKASVKKAAKKTAPKSGSGISPKKALANTRKLLARHNAEAQSPKPWQQIEEGAAAAPAAGYQSGQAERKAIELHAAQSRMAPIQGSISTRDRRNQGKRDHRNVEE